MNLKPKQRILVLTNCLRSESKTLSHAIELAKLVQGAVDVLCVNPLDELKSDLESNQVKVLRNIKTTQEHLKQKLKQRVEKIIQEDNVPIIYNILSGSLTDSVRDHLECTKPDIVVLGHTRKLTSFWFKSDLLLTVLKYHPGVILMSRAKHFLLENKLGIGFIGQFEHNHRMVQTLLKKTVGQYRFFQFNFKDKKSSSEKVKGLTTYNFDARLSTHLNYSKYFEREGIDIYCIKRTLFTYKAFFENEKQYLLKTVLNTEKPILVFPN
jgi:DNA-directed RNA polymerase subunit N (RpoN/RPB10)/nucleotide-binding universal stress UspA family protein